MDRKILRDYCETAERDIRWAFRFVTREGGVSWNESYVIDDRGCDSERAKARASDTDTQWSDLVEDKKWEPWRGLGGFCFLDAVGFRYYLPPAMIRNLRRLPHGENASADSLAHLGADLDFHLGKRADKDGDWDEARWEIFTDEQRGAIARYLLVEAIAEQSERNDPVRFIADPRNAYWLRRLLK